MSDYKERIAELERAVEGMVDSSSCPDDLRAQGWTVKLHEDYQRDEEPRTSWLLVKGYKGVKGDGRTDAEALDKIRAQIREAQE